MFPEVVVRDSLCCVLVLAREFYLTTSLSKSLLIIVHLAELIHALSGIIFMWIKIKLCSNILIFFCGHAIYWPLLQDAFDGPPAEIEKFGPWIGQPF